jgi:DNA ligase-1
MASPAKKRKLNNGSKQSSLPARGLEYFFAKQQNGQSSSKPVKSVAKPETVAQTGHGETQNGDLDSVNTLTADEELARKLQAEWDSEARGRNGGEHQADKDESEVIPGQSTASARDLKETPHAEDPRPVGFAKTTSAEPSLAKGTLSLSSAAATEDVASASIPLDESPLTFNPSEYIGKLQESWSTDGGNASYALLTRCFVLVNGTASRIKIVDTLVNCMRLLIEADPDSLLPAVWLATNAISPPYISMELGLGGSAISKALKNVCGLDNRSLKSIYDKLGDPGDVAFEAKKKQSFTLRKPKPLTIKSVYQSLVKIATTQGQGSGEVKQRIVDRLLQDARGGEESRYIVRTLCQHVSLPLAQI